MALTTLQDLIDGFGARADAPAVVAPVARGEPDRWTYARLGDEITRAASGLRAAGVAPGEVIGLLAPNAPEWIAALLAIIRCGAIAMPLSEQVTEDELGRVIAHSGCRRFVTTAPHVKGLETLELTDELEIILLESLGEVEGERRLPLRRWGALTGGQAERLPDLEPEQPAALLYTSGTTGTPKGVPLTHANLCSDLSALLDAELATADDRVLLPLPLYHAYPLTVGLLATLAIGATLVLPAGITGPQIAAALKDERCTIMIAVPRLYEALVSGIEDRLRRGPRLVTRPIQGLLDLSVRLRRRAIAGRRIGRTLFWPLRRRLGPELRLLASGGARLDPDVAWKLEGLGFEVLTGYGLTETSPILTFNPPGRARIESTGLPVAGVDLRIAPAEGTEQEQGEIQARGPSVFGGYWKNEEATRESFTDDGYFRTGDLGFLDPDRYLFIVGRQKELIVLAGGKNVFPDEVEAVYGTSELVRELAVLEHQNRLVGLFVPDPDTTDGVADDDLRARVRAEIERLSPKLPSYARLADFVLTRRPLPRTQIGKLRRHELPEIFEREKSGAGRPQPRPARTAADRALIETPPGDRVWAWLEERFEGQVLTLDTSPQLDLGLDSFDWMSLSMELQERFGVHLDEDAIARVTTLRDLLREVEQAGRATAPDDHELSPEQARWLEPQGRITAALGRLLYGLNRAIMRGLFRLRVEGAEQLPAHGPYLIAPNHMSYLDPFAIAAALPWDRLRQVYWAGWTGLLFRGPLTRLFSRATHVVPVDPERGLTSTLAIGRAVLEQDKILVWFPEGRRSPTGELQPFLPGAGWLLEKSGVASVPVLIEGTHDAWPPDRSLPRLRRLSVRIGQPVALDQISATGERTERHAEIAARLRERVVALGASPSDEAKPAAE